MWSERWTLNLSEMDHNFLMVWELAGQEKVQQQATYQGGGQMD
jgi:hypothetical protein